MDADHGDARSGSEHEERRGDDARRRFQELIHGQRFALVATADGDGRVGTRPLTTMDRDVDGSLWFVVSRSADWVRTLDGGTWVTASYVDTDHQRWVSAVGRGELSEDRGRLGELWNPMVQAWFPGGPDDPDVCLLRVDVEHADVWDSERSRLLRLVDMARAVVGDHQPDIGRREDLELS